MPEVAGEPQSNLTTSDAESGARRMTLLWQLLAIAAGVAAVAWIWRMLLGWLGPGAATLLIQTPLTILTGCLAWRFAVGHDRKWVRPARQLARLIEEIHAGETPIESLSEVTGAMAPVARTVQELLRDFRRERQAKSRVQIEMSQQILDRTEVLRRETKQWQIRAFRDPLTDLCNRRQLDELLPRVIEDCHRQARCLSVLAVDMDHFKSVNDTLGHDAGDRLLRDTGKLIQSNLREGDYGFRLGGDEFLILLPGYDLKSGEQLAQRLTSLVAQLAATIKSDPRPGISIGLVCVTDLRSLDPADLLRQADAAMYAKKALRKAKKIA